MSQMKKILLAEALQIKPASLSKGWGFFAFTRGEESLFASYSSIPLKRVLFLAKLSESERDWAELFEQADTIYYTENTSEIEALRQYKSYLQTHNPSLQSQLFPPRDYVYLALNAAVFPFVKITEHTTEDWLYLGPFRSRFFLADFIDSLSRILKTPYCETGTFPCDKFDRDLCRGWCLNLSVEEESEQARDLAKLEKLLFESYLTPSDTVLKLLKKQFDQYNRNLEFEKAELFKESIELHERYRNWLNFLIASKSLSFELPDYRVVAGQLAAARINDSWQEFHTLPHEHRPNEILAMDKALVDEAKVIYDLYLKNIEVINV